MNKLLRIFIWIFLVIPSTLMAQESQQHTFSSEEINRYKEQIKQLTGYLEGTLNFLGDGEAPSKEKEIVINDSYLKIFKDDKVQIEDDLDENRDVPIHKDVQAYLKDIEFFFRKAEFKFHIVSIDHFMNDLNGHYFKVTFNRDLNAITITGDTVSSRKVRYMEINLDLAKNDLRIASIYTTKINEKEEIRNWWNGLSLTWRQIFGEKIILFDSIPLSDIIYFEDSLILVSKPHLPDTGTAGRYELELPVQRANALEIDRSVDTLRIGSKSIMIYLNGIKKQQEIDLSDYGSIRDLEPLSELTELTLVNCSNTLITSLFPLRNLNKLEDLDCSNTPIVDLSPLQYSRSLKSLNIAYTLVNDLEPLRGLFNLENIDFSGLRITDIKVIDELSHLKVIKMNDTHVGQLEAISELTDLVELDASGTHIHELSALSDLNKLRVLNVENSSISSLKPLSNLQSLEVLRISHTLVDSLYPLNGLPNLKRIYWDGEEMFPEALEHKRERAIEFMKKNPGTLVIFESEELLKSWQELEKPWKDLAREAAQLSENPSKEELHGLLQISSVFVEGKPITTLKPVRRLYNLQILDASGVQVADYSPLADALELEELNLSGSSAKNLDFAAKLKKLRILNIENTSVTSLKPLTQNENLKYIYADKSMISPDEAFAFAKAHPDCIVIFDTPGITEWWNTLPNGWKEFFTSQYKVDAPPSSEQLHEIIFLQSLEISGPYTISTLLPLTRMKILEVLKLKELQVSSLNPLTELPALRELLCNQMPVSDLTPLSSLTKLEALNFENTPVEELGPLESLKNLKSLNISGTQVDKLKSLSGLTSLEFLALNNTQVKRLKHIENISALKTVECFNTRVSQKDIDRFKEANPDCKVVYY
ncbi:MAG: hypothetical protein KQI35_05220 [Bacteroidetes bacterium]|nr:hypothetical protein [Bacteroidota bacterium]